jgi:hypothetical protein
VIKGGPAFREGARAMLDRRIANNLRE